MIAKAVSYQSSVRNVSHFAEFLEAVTNWSLGPADKAVL